MDGEYCPFPERDCGFCSFHYTKACLLDKESDNENNEERFPDLSGGSKQVD